MPGARLRAGSDMLRTEREFIFYAIIKLQATALNSSNIKQNTGTTVLATSAAELQKCLQTLSLPTNHDLTFGFRKLYQ